MYNRQLHVRLLLLRPVLSNFIVSEFPDDDDAIPLGSILSHRVSLQCAIVCVKVAIEAIETVFRHRGSHPSALGSCAAWWYNVLYLYTSATALIAARTSATILAEVPKELILESWNKAIQVLEEYSRFGPSIRRLSTTLRLLSEAVPQQYSRFKENSRQSHLRSLPVSQAQAQAPAPSVVPLPYWDLTNFVSTPVDDPTRENLLDNNMTDLTDPIFDLDRVFDPNDLSWLMTIPLDNA